MYGWTDPMDPNGAPRRAERQTDEPDWLRDRPEPRSAYLFGDDPDRPGDEWQREEPTARWQSEPAAPADAHTAARPTHPPTDAPTHWHGRADTTAGWHADADAEADDAWGTA
ncbi:hypothetical protein JNW91_30300, partial [Micromonospora sp. STR1_7]|nr:hypothetical protein [Micromonospora parastrephiae]